MVTLNDVIASFSTLNDSNEVVAFNFADFDKLVSELYTKRAELRKANKANIKATADANKDRLAEIGKEYYLSLENDTIFYYTTADGTKVTAKKIATKSKECNSAGCEVIEGIEFKSDNHKRYPKFHQVIVPTDYVD